MPPKATQILYNIAAIFYISWTGFRIMFLLGPESTNLLNKHVTKAGFAFFDIISKNVYAMHGWYLRWQILYKHQKRAHTEKAESEQHENEQRESE